MMNHCYPVGDIPDLTSTDETDCAENPFDRKSTYVRPAPGCQTYIGEFVSLLSKFMRSDFDCCNAEASSSKGQMSCGVYPNIFKDIEEDCQGAYLSADIFKKYAESHMCGKPEKTGYHTRRVRVDVNVYHEAASPILAYYVKEGVHRKVFAYNESEFTSNIILVIYNG